MYILLGKRERIREKAIGTAVGVATEAKERGSESLIGIGLLVVALAILNALATWLAKRDPQPELAQA